METTSNKIFCETLLLNVDPKQIDAWTRRLAWATSLGEEDIPTNLDLEDVRDTLEANLSAVCKTDWEIQNMLSACKNDGSSDSLTAVLRTLTDRLKAKLEAGAGDGAKGSRYGKLAVALSEDGAVTHKTECEPEQIFKTNSTTLATQWAYLRPPPQGQRVRPNTTWELRLTDRFWNDTEDERKRFVLIRGNETPKEGPERDDVLNETWSGSYTWAPLVHRAVVYDDYELTLELPAFGNTDRHTGEGSSLTIIYKRNVDNSKVLNYTEHIWGRTNTSEMHFFDHMFPPRLTEVPNEELDDDAVDELINMSLARLSKGAAAGVEEHGAYLPGQRQIEEA